MFLLVILSRLVPKGPRYSLLVLKRLPTSKRLPTITV